MRQFPLLSPRAERLLEYIHLHPGCWRKDAREALEMTGTQVEGYQSTLQHRCLIDVTEDRREGSVASYELRLWPLEHGSGQVESSGNISPGLAQDGVVAVPALLPEVTA